MTKQQLIDSIYNKNSFLCIGLDSDYNKLPSCILDNDDPIFEFNRRIIDATHKYAVAYKPNIAFYESRGSQGWQSLEKTVDYIRKVDDSIFIIADAKRGDIGNTSKQYAIAFFQNIDFDAVTVAPYMGKDSVTPFLSFDGKWVILLALTSNEGAYDFQFIKAGEKHLFETVIETSKQWGANEDNMMYVVGATKAEMLSDIRNIIPEHFLLVPGVGAQGGSLQEVAKNGLNNQCGLLVNSSRAIIYADNTENFATSAAIAAQAVQAEMESILKQNNLI